MISALAFTIFAIFVAEAYEQLMSTHDAKEVVIDEVAGYLVAMTWLPLTWQSFVFSFLLFRCLDICKPYPIGFLDKNIKGGMGVVVDDIAAGLVSNVVLQWVFLQTHWLGGSLSLK